MPRVKPGQRQRVYRPKTRTGCRTCKARRVKCDEGTDPAGCRNCLLIKRVCGGYDVDIQEHRKTPSLQPVISAPLSFAESKAELRALSFYRHRTGVQIVGFRNREFWTSLVPQIAHVDVGVRHALIALATFHEDFETGREIIRDSNFFALKHYNLAIRQHVEIFNDCANVTIAEAYQYMVPCIIFLCIEILLANHRSAVALVERAKNLLQVFVSKNKDENSQDSTYGFLAMIQSLFFDIESQAASFAGRADGYPEEIPVLAISGNTNIPDVFESLAEAQTLMEYHGRAYNRPAFTAHNRGCTDQYVLAHLLRAGAPHYLKVSRSWEIALRAFLDKNVTSLTEQELQTATLLKLHHLHNHVFLDVISSGNPLHNECVWDDYYAHYDEIVTLAESLFTSMENFRSLTTTPPSTKATFSIDIGIIGNMCDVGLRCRDPSLRRRAVRVLTSNPRKEGLWDSVTAARILQRIIEIEEAGLNVLSRFDVPKHHRIFNLDLNINMENCSCRLLFDRHASAEDETIVHIRELMTW